MKMKKYFTFLFASAFLINNVAAQQTLCDFEGSKSLSFGYMTGTIDTMAVNPFPSAANSSDSCAKYVRDSDMYDFIVMIPDDKFVDVSPYATSAAGAKKISIKLYTSAPVGTPVTVQLGSKADGSYPGGVHSEYTGVTTVQNGWQTITFNFLQMGGFTSSTNVDKMVLLFNPGQTTTETIYIDDIVGPEVLVVSGMVSHEGSAFKLFPVTPNPSKNVARISFQLNAPGKVSLQLYDMLGKPVRTLLEPQMMKPGMYSVPVNTDDIHGGIYFYVLRKDGTERSMKLIVSK
jgi:hypothetical protein